MPAGNPIQGERDVRIAELEREIAGRGGVGVSASVAALGLTAALLLLGLRQQEIRYFFSSSQAVSLGIEGAYQLDQLQSNRYVQIHGRPTRRGLYATENGKPYVMVGLQGTPVIVRRHPFSSEVLVPGKPAPQPNQSPFAVRGRLLAQSDAARYAESMHKMLEFGEMNPRDGRLWILLEGERPGSNMAALFSFLALVAFAVGNGWFLWRNLRPVNR